SPITPSSATIPLQHEGDLAAVQALMIKLRTLTQSTNRRLITELRSVIRQDTQDDDIMEVLTSPASNKRLRGLFKELKDVEFVAKALQGRDVDLQDVRQWFDELIALKPQFETHI
ncbi:hypothetical protein L917_03538, partial [Phytophthora nicotianae]